MLFTVLQELLDEPVLFCLFVMLVKPFRNGDFALGERKGTIGEHVLDCREKCNIPIHLDSSFDPRCKALGNIGRGVRDFLDGS